MACCGDNCDSIGRFCFPSVFSGDSLIGFEIEIEEENAQADLDDVAITFSTPGTQDALLVLGDGTGLTILQATPPWIISVDDIETVTLDPGTYIGRVRTTDGDGISETYLEATWVIR